MPERRCTWRAANRRGRMQRVDDVEDIVRATERALHRRLKMDEVTKLARMGVSRDDEFAYT